MASVFSQQMPVVQTDYLQKSKNHKTAGWILLGGGSALLITGIMSGKNTSIDNWDTLGLIIIAGGGAVFGSIPLFVTSAINKRKAKASNAFFKMETMPVVQQHSFVQRSFPAVSVKISL